MKYEDLEIGQKVKVVRSYSEHIYDLNNSWEDEMDDYVLDGNVYTISDFNERGVCFEEDYECFKFPWQSIKLFEDVPKLNKINVMTTQMSVFRKGSNPIFGEGVTYIKIDDEAAGPFIVISQDENEIKLDEDEIQVVADAAKKLLDDSKIYFKEG